MRARIDPDEYDLSQLRETCDSPGYGLIAAKYREARQAELEKLASIDPADLRFAQGFLAGLARGEQLPKILADEIRGRARKKARANNALDS